MQHLVLEGAELLDDLLALGLSLRVLERVHGAVNIINGLCLRL